MHATEHLARLGGVTRIGLLRSVADSREIRRALQSGDILREGRGHFALPNADPALRAAARHTAVLSHLSAATHHGWAVLREPERPHLTLPASRKVGPARDIVVHRAELTPADVDGWATARRRTLLDCARNLPFAEGLAVADSALRSGRVGVLELRELGDSARGRGAGRIRRVTQEATALAANPFESALRAIACGVDGLDVRPQVRIGGALGALGTPDLVDVGLRLVLEADSFEFHGSRAALDRDATRYNAMVVDGWLVLRFSWDAVMFRPWEVRATIEQATEKQRRALRLV